MKEDKIKKLIDKYESLIEELYEIASDPKTSKASLKRLSELTDSYVLQGLIGNANIPTEILLEMLDLFSGNGGTDEEVRIHIVYNPALDREKLEDIIKNDNSKNVQETALTSLIKLISSDPNSDGTELLKFYNRVVKNDSIENIKRKQVSIRSLLNHPNFPHNKIEVPWT